MWCPDRFLKLIMWIIQINDSLYLSQNMQWAGKFKSMAKNFESEEEANECIKKLKRYNKQFIFKSIKKQTT